MAEGSEWLETTFVVGMNGCSVSALSSSSVSSKTLGVGERHGSVCIWTSWRVAKLTEGKDGIYKVQNIGCLHSIQLIDGTGVSNIQKVVIFRSLILLEDVFSVVVGYSTATGCFSLIKVTLNAGWVLAG